VPLTAAGNLSIVASADLGPLGSKAGTPLEYHWELPNVAPQLLPWLVILGLLALKPNRNGAAWLIWLPVGCALAITGLPLALPSGASFLLDAAVAFVFGLAAVWLLSTYLRRGQRFVTSLCVLIVLGAFGLVSLLFKQSTDLSSGNWIPAAMVLGFGVLVSAGALLAGGWLCRRCFGPVRLYLSLLVSLLALWLALPVPFFLVALSTSGGQVAWSEFFIPVTAVAGVNFALLLPFLVLSSAHPLFRERLKSLLHVQPLAPPPLNVPSAPAVTLTT